MKRRLALWTILAAALFAAPVSVHAQRISQMPDSAPGGLGSRIIAVVNDNVISSSDLNARIAMALISSGLPDSPEVRQRLAVQILRSMIDEQLQLQEAKKLDITISQKEIDAALERIATDNKVPGGDIKAFLAARGIPTEPLITQIRAGLSWSKVVQRELRPRVDVGDDEIDAVIERTRANVGKEEYLVSEIFLSVDSPKDDDQVRQFAENLVQQIKQGGNIGAIARQFSQNASAAAGGDIGWIQEGQLPSELNNALISMTPGSIEGPIRTASGYHILGLREKRTIELGAGDAKDMSVELQQAFRAFGSTPNRDALLKDAAKLRDTISDCKNLAGNLASQFPGWHWQDLGEVKLASAPSWLADKARDLPVGKPSEAMATDKGALIIFVCGRKMPEGKADREAITNQIGTEKLETQARGLLRDLRREAYLDVRLNG